MHNRPLVDPFIPAGPRPQPTPAASPPQPAVQPRQVPRRSGSIDGVVSKPQPFSSPTKLPAKAPHKPHLQPHPMLQRRPVASRPATATRPSATSKASASRPPARPYAKPAAPPQPAYEHHKPRPELRKHWNLGKLAIVGITLGVIFGGLSLFSLQLGQIVIGIYAIIAVWRRLPSRLTFLLALLMFGGIILSQLFIPDSGISENLAVYAFLLLCVGTLSLAREVRS